MIIKQDCSYQGKALNVPTAPELISNSFWEKKKLKTYKMWAISKCEMLSRTKLIRPIRLALNSNWNDFVVLDNSLGRNNSRNALSKTNKFFKTLVI